MRTWVGGQNRSWVVCLLVAYLIFCRWLAVVGYILYAVFNIVQIDLVFESNHKSFPGWLHRHHTKLPPLRGWRSRSLLVPSLWRPHNISSITRAKPTAFSCFLWFSARSRGHEQGGKWPKIKLIQAKSWTVSVPSCYHGSRDTDCFNPVTLIEQGEWGNPHQRIGYP